MSSDINDFGRFIHEDFIEQELRFSEIYHYLDKYKSKDLYNVKQLMGNPDVKDDRIVWIMWMQGLENAPDLIKKCCSSIYKNIPENYRVILLTAQNIQEYVELPEYIWEKYNKGIISKAHLADVIRLELLCTYGGCWIDATVFCSRAIPEYMLSDMFLFKLNSVLTTPVIKMSNWWLAADKNNKIMHATRHMLNEYWKKEDVLHNYFIFHIIMSKIIDEDSSCRAIFQDIPFFNSANAQILIAQLGSPYSKKRWEMLRDSSFVQKLTYKRRYIKGDVYNFYMALLDGKLDFGGR